MHHDVSAPGHERSGRERSIISCVESLLEAKGAAFAEGAPRWSNIDICVVDDRSNPPIDTLLSPKILREVRVLRNRGARGQGGALNYAIATLNADVFAFTDSDCVVARDWCTCLLAQYCHDETLAGVAGPNWHFAPATTRWQRFLTAQESRLLAHTFDTYLDSARVLTRRIDCRSFSIRASVIKHGFADSSFFVHENGPSVSSQTSYRLQSRGELDDMLIGFAPNWIVFHEPIYDLISLLTTYYWRGRKGLFRTIYAASFGGLGRAFIRHYFQRHFIAPWAQGGVSMFYVALVHSAYWLGIILPLPRSS